MYSWLQCRQKFMLVSNPKQRIHYMNAHVLRGPGDRYAVSAGSILPLNAIFTCKPRSFFWANVLVAHPS